MLSEVGTERTNKIIKLSKTVTSSWRYQKDRIWVGQRIMPVGIDTALSQQYVFFYWW